GRDAVLSQAGEEPRESIVVRLQLGHVLSLAGTEGAVRIAGKVVIVVRVLYVAVHDRNSRFEHLGEIAQSLGRGGIEARKAWIAFRIGNGLAVEIRNSRLAAGDGRGDGLVAEQGLEARISAGLIGQHIRLPVRAERAALGAVYGDALEVGRCQRAVGRRLVVLG